MNNKLLIFFYLSILILVSSCSKDEEKIIQEPESELSEYEIEVINYFKNIALGFEFGNASNITRKWNTELKVFIGGEPGSELLSEFNKIKTEINELVSDGFKITLVNDSALSNYYVFFGTGDKYAQMFPVQLNLVSSNWGLFYINWNSQNQFYSGHMYVDVERADLTEQKHLLREEFTQSLGLAKDSPTYPESIFQSAWTTTTEYASIDKELIRLLYHPNMRVGLNRIQVDDVLRNILNTVSK